MQLNEAKTAPVPTPPQQVEAANQGQTEAQAGAAAAEASKRPLPPNRRLWIHCTDDDDDASSLTVPKFIAEADMKYKAKRAKYGGSEESSDGAESQVMRESLADTASGLTMEQPIEYGQFVGRGVLSGLAHGIGRAFSSIFQSRPRTDDNNDDDNGDDGLDMQSHAFSKTSESEATAPIIYPSGPKIQIATSP